MNRQILGMLDTQWTNGQLPAPLQAVPFSLSDGADSRSERPFPVGSPSSVGKQSVSSPYVGSSALVPSAASMSAASTSAASMSAASTSAAPMSAAPTLSTFSMDVDVAQQNEDEDDYEKYKKKNARLWERQWSSNRTNKKADGNPFIYGFWHPLGGPYPKGLWITGTKSRWAHPLWGHYLPPSGVCVVIMDYPGWFPLWRTKELYGEPPYNQDVQQYACAMYGVPSVKGKKCRARMVKSACLGHVAMHRMRGEDTRPWIKLVCPIEF